MRTLRAARTVIDVNTRPSALYRPNKGQALLETALVIPILMMLLVGVVGISQLWESKMAVRAVAREAARSGATSGTEAAAKIEGVRRGYEIASSYGLDTTSLRIEITEAEIGPWGRVTASASYRVDLRFLPIFSRASVRVGGVHTEPVDLYRSLPSPEQREEGITP